VCGVASLGYEHQTLLGHTLASIAWNKGGIFKVSVDENVKISFS